MEQEYFKIIRNSRMSLNEVYFWTDTIKDWKHLLKRDEYKLIIIEQLKWLVDKRKIVVYGYVIMSNHLHLIWELCEKNGKEMPHASFNKWTSNSFLKDLRINHSQILPFFEEKSKERNYRFWKRDPLAIHLDSQMKIEQKLEYIHLNPMQEHWNLVSKPEDYRWSSTKYYMDGKDEFCILTHYKERF